MALGRNVVVVGAGWSGAVVARELHDAGVRVEVLESAAVVGGHARCERLNGVVYEPQGAHIFHTSDERVARYVTSFGMCRRYDHRVLSRVEVAPGDERLLSWPPQLGELRLLPQWPTIERELAERPDQPHGEDFETWVVALMGRTLYELFVEHYTVKQWGRHPSQLSSRFAPRRVELRDDGDTRLFRDRWELFPAEGVNSTIERVLAPVPVCCGVDATLDDLVDLRPRPDAFVVTAPIDDLVGRPGALEWRGIRMVSRYVPTDDPAGTVTPAYVVNHPSPSTPFTRTVETKHATGQRIAGTVVSEEHPGAPARHYPVPTVDDGNEARNVALQREITEALAPGATFFCGRLATYTYIDQDQAIAGALDCAGAVLAALG